MINKETIQNLELMCILDNANAALTGLISPIEDIFYSLTKQKFNVSLEKCLEFYNIFESIVNLKDEISNFIKRMPVFNEDTGNVHRKLWWFTCGISCIQLFVQINWTGPLVDVVGVSEEISQYSLHSLNLDDQHPYHLTSHLHLLYTAKCIFAALLNDSSFTCFQTISWWLFRCHCIHSQLLPQRSESLFTATKALIPLIHSAPFLKENCYRSLLFQFHLEAGLSLLHYYDYKGADNSFECARSVVGIDFGFTGALGLRTKFQTKPVSQLQVMINKTSVESLKSLVSLESSKCLPKNLTLDDDTLLEKVKLLDQNEVNNPSLNAEEYCMILSSCSAMQKTNPSHRLKQEKIQAALEFLLDSASCWCIHAEALRMRCLNEKDRSRTVERSMMQLEELVKLISRKDASAPSRLTLFYAVRPPPLWILQKDLAKLYISLGAMSSALQIYLKLEMWEDAILCLIRTDRSAEAMRLIKKRLEVDETANLWCLLGDILQEPKHYLKAWEFSNQKSTRAMTSLGYYYISTKEFKKAVECFEKSLSILSLQVNTWFTMGCALLRIEEYQKAANAFRRCVGLDWDNYEAWTNLSSSYVRCGKKNEAHKSLSEAIKCNFDKWQLWENFVAISTDVGKFNDAISAYSRLLDLKRKYVDIPVLEALVRAVTEDIPDADGMPGSSYKSKLLSLFGHVTSQTTSDARIWELYACLCGNGVGSNKEENEKAITFLQKTLRNRIQKQSWEKDEETIKSSIDACQKLNKACLNCQDYIPSVLVSSIRLSINGFISKLKQREKSLIDPTVQDTLKNYVNEANECYESINKIFLNLKKS